MEEIIKKAIEGGYESMGGIKGDTLFKLLMKPTANQELLFLYPLFWQALGTKCGWEYKNIPKELIGKKKDMLMWQINALKFHKINLTQGLSEAIKWLNELIKN